jgi:hypothetical protein
MWQCPACEQEIERRPGELLPMGHVIYRCLACRLELIFDEDYARFKLAPFNKTPEHKSPRPRSRRAPDGALAFADDRRKRRTKR